MKIISNELKFFGSLCLSLILVVSLTPFTYPGFASPLPRGLGPAGVENNEDEETAYLKFASQAVKQSDNKQVLLLRQYELPEGSKRTSNPCERDT